MMMMMSIIDTSKHTHTYTHRRRQAVDAILCLNALFFKLKIIYKKNRIFS